MKRTERPAAGRRSQARDQRPVEPAPCAAGRYVDGSYLDRNPTWHAEDAAWKARQIAALLRDHKVQPCTVVEVGCGSGQVLAALQTQLASDVDCTGYEIAPQALALARSLERAGLRFVQGELPLGGQAADLLLLVDVIEHVEDVYGFVRRHATLGRHLVLHVPLDLSVQTVLRAAPIVDQRRRVGHLHAFTRETLLCLLDDVGLEVVAARYTHGSVELAHYQDGIARLLRWPRRLLDAINQDLSARLLGGSSLLVLAQARAEPEVVASGRSSKRTNR